MFSFVGLSREVSREYKESLPNITNYHQKTCSALIFCRNFKRKIFSCNCLNVLSKLKSTKALKFLMRGRITQLKDDKLSLPFLSPPDCGRGQHPGTCITNVMLGSCHCNFLSCHNQKGNFRQNTIRHSTIGDHPPTTHHPLN